MNAAIENLKTCQQQLDADGCMVGVSRQALEEALMLHGNLVHACELARTAFDDMMGDCDLPQDDSLMMKAMQALSAVLPDPG